MKQLYSNCCYAEMRLDYAKDICPACKEGCGVEEEVEETLLGYDVGKEGGDETLALYGKRYKDGSVEITKTVKGLPLEEPAPYQPRVGDRVSVEVMVVEVEPEVVWLRGHGVLMGVNQSEVSCLTLLSRKPPRTLTKAEAEALLTEKLGESVEIE